MLTLLAALAIQTSNITIERDPYGVPLIKASSQSEAFFQAGYATAQDRMWQMENSRRLARGRMAEVFGKSYVPSDRETLKIAYTDSELLAQFDKLKPAVQESFRKYAEGVNAHLETAKANGTLPLGYKEHGFAPTPWSLEDSLAIGVLLLHQFGRFGAGELRNLALLAYLDSQPNARDKKLDILDDLIWQNDPRAITTIADDGKKHPIIFPPFTRAMTERQLAAIPKMSLIELLPGMRLAAREESKLVASRIGTPFKAGSYAIVVGPKRSATGHPILLSAPQMGFTSPSVVHEISIQAPGLDVVGIGVPGVPGIAVGATPKFAWGLTSGVADTDDVFWCPTRGDKYVFNGQELSFTRTTRTLNVKGEPSTTVDRIDTIHGPVVLKTRDAVFVRRAPSRGAELQTSEAFLEIPTAQSPDAIDAALRSATMNFNFFYAFGNGEIGYTYTGLVPLRAPNLDPRLPTLANKANDWRGVVAFDDMPATRNPGNGLLFNWNNKPVSWWPNGDSPVWGEMFRVSELAGALKSKKLTPTDVEQAAWSIARRDFRFEAFSPWFKRSPEPPSPSGGDWVGGEGHLPLFARSQAYGYDGWSIQSSVGATVFSAWFDSLRKELFQPTTGSFVNPELFSLAVSPNVMLRALQGKTRVNYLGNRKPEELLRKSWLSTLDTLTTRRGADPASWGYQAGTISVEGEAPILYRDRGTYIQIVQPGPWGSFGKNVLPPGQAETGTHKSDQVDLARMWSYKPMVAK